MDSLEIWNSYHCSICSIIFSDSNQNRISSGTGFKVNDLLITNNHVVQIERAKTVKIKFVNSDGHTTNVEQNFSIDEFKSLFKEGMPESSWDFAIYDLKETEFNNIPNLRLAKNKSYPIGSEVSVLGFQFDNNNLSIKKGLISSCYTNNSVKYIEIDASINQGNSGGPLIYNNTGEVIGVVTRKNTGLSQLFDTFYTETKDLVDKSYLEMNNRKNDIYKRNNYTILYQVVTKLETISKEIKRSSNVGIGYAYQLDEILKTFR